MHWLGMWSAALVLMACGSDGGGGSGGAAAQQPLGAGQCREKNDCSDIEECVSPGTASLCGGTGCPPNECNADFDCLGGGVDDVCVDHQGVRVCEPPCGSMKPCEEYEACATDGHCEKKACAADADCPADFSCLGDVCERRFCDTDATCGGYCVQGSCYPDPGACEQPVA